MSTSTKRTASGLIKDGSTEAKEAALIKEAVAKIDGLPAAEALRALVHSVVVDADEDCCKLARLLRIDAAQLKPLFGIEDLKQWEPSVAALIFGITAAAECIQEDEEFQTSVEALECAFDRMDSCGAYTTYEENETSMLDVINRECEVSEHADVLTDVLSDISHDHVPGWVSDAVSIKFKALYPKSSYAVDNEPDSESD
jgi:hypothetical protein